MSSAVLPTRPSRSWLGARVALVGLTSLALIGGVAQTAHAALPTGPTATGLTGERPSATALDFPVSDQVQASVDVVTGNLLVNTLGLSLPGVNETISIGGSYNSLGWQTGGGDLSANNWSWDFASAGSLSLVGANIVYTGADGVTWTFVPVSGSATAYTSPAGFKQDLAKTSTGTYTLTDRESRRVVTFDADGKARSVVDRNGNTTQITYDGYGAPTSVVSTAGPTAARTATLSYNGSTRALRVQQVGTGYGTRTVVYQKDASSNLTSITDAEGNRTTFAYSGRDLTSITSVTGAVTRFTYDGSTHKVTHIDQENTSAGSPGTSTTRLAYTSTAQTLVASPNTDSAVAVTSVPRTTYTINPTQKLVTKAIDQAGRERSATYTGNADVNSSTIGQSGAATSGTTTGDYGANSGNSLTKTTSAGGAASSTTYGTTAATAYLPASTTDDAGNQSLKTFNGAGNQLTNADASGATATLTYNTDGTVATATAPGNGTNKTTYTYDGNKQLSGVTPVTGSSLGAKAYTYDAFGRIATQTDGRGNTTTTTYDNLDRVTKTTVSNGPSETNTYDAAGRLLYSASPAGTITNTYDQLGRQLSTRNTAGGGTVSYTYDKAGNQLTQTDSFGTYTNTYDASNVLTKSTYPKAGGTQAIEYETDANGRRTNTWLQASNNRTTWAGKQTTGYDPSGRVTTLKAWTGTGDASNTPVYDTTYCYNTASAAPTCGTAKVNDRAKIQWSRDNLTGQVTTYTYDTQGRVTKAAQTGGTAANTYSYTYDARGNRLTAVVTGANPSSQTLTYNAANQITTAGYTYDGAGNMTASPSTAFTYNSAQQMTQAVENGITSSYTYAGVDQKAVLSQSVSSGNSYAATYGKADQNGNPTIVKYSGGSSEAHVFSDPVTGQALMLTTSSDISALYVWDGLGNPVGLLTDFSTNSFSYAYDPYGTRALTAGGTGNGPGQNPYSFKSGIQDRGTGLVKFGLRWYEPTTGTWTQQDTLDAPFSPSDANRYAFAGSDPINSSDPTGRATGCQIAGFAATVVGAAATVAGAAVSIAAAPATGGLSVAGYVGGIATVAGVGSAGFGVATGYAGLVGRC